MTSRRIAPVPAATQSASNDLESAQRVLQVEIEGLRALATALDDSFTRAVDILFAVGGEGGRARVIVSGMGKSGHVARKIAATMASTGTPAFFVHPAEASHGDLGMIAKGDALLCLSNSGDVPELADLVAHAKRFGIPLIGMTSKARSALGQAADIVLLLPRAEEACPMGLAPTTSTTLMMALGDALAVALLERRGFTRDDYRLFHPGGRLGRMLTKIGDVMHAGDQIPLAPSGTTMRDALLVMTAKSFGCVGVVDRSGRLAGIVTDGDLRRHMDNDLLSLTVDAVMTPAPKTIRPQALAVEAVALMNAKQITSLFVVDGDGRPAGIVHIHDCLRAGVV